MHWKGIPKIFQTGVAFAERPSQLRNPEKNVGILVLALPSGEIVEIDNGLKSFDASPLTQLQLLL